MSDSLVQIATTMDTREKAQAMARELVEQRLAACVQIDGPIQSWYRWQDKLESADEWRLSVKTTSDACATVLRRIRELHTYEVPEIIAVPIDQADVDYAKWTKEQVG